MASTSRQATGRPAGPACARPRRDRQRAADAPCRGRRVGRARRERGKRRRYQTGDLDPPPKLCRRRVAQAAGRSRAAYKAVAPGPYEDAYGAGDCFAAALTFALAKEMEIPDALTFASERGALALTRRGAGLKG